MTVDVLGPDNAFWIDGEWLGWDSIIDPEETRYSRRFRCAKGRY